MDFNSQKYAGPFFVIFIFMFDSSIAGKRNIDHYPKSTIRNCIYYCESEQQQPGLYPSCIGCYYFVECRRMRDSLMTVVKKCAPDTEWDDDKRACLEMSSSTCMLQEDQNEETTKKEDKSQTSTASIQPGEDCSDPIFPCEYAILVAAVLGLAPLLTCLLCHLCRQHGRNTNIKKASVSTQIPEHYVTDDVDSAIYDDLQHNNNEQQPANGYQALEAGYQQPGPTYQVPHNYSQIGSPPNYQDLQLPNSYEALSNEANPYLELNSYSYLHTQKSDVKVDIDRVLLPVIMNLCEKYKNKPKEYIQLQNELINIGKN